MTITSGNSSYAGWPLAKASYSSLQWKWLTRPLVTTVLLAGLRHQSAVMGVVLRLFCLVGYENSLKRRPQMMWKDMYHLHLMRHWINFSFLFARWVFSDRNILHSKEACRIIRKKLNVRFSMEKIKSCRTKNVFLALMMPEFFVEASLFIHVRQKFI